MRGKSGRLARNLITGAMFGAGVLLSLTGSLAQEDVFNSNGAGARQGDCDREKNDAVIALRRSYREGIFEKLDEERTLNLAERRKRDLSCNLEKEKARRTCLANSQRQYEEKETAIDKKLVDAQAQEQIGVDRIVAGSCPPAGTRSGGSEPSLPPVDLPAVPFKPFTREQAASLRNRLGDIVRCKAFAQESFSQQIQASRRQSTSDRLACIQKSGNAQACEAQANESDRLREMAIESKRAQVTTNFDNQIAQIQTMLNYGGYITDPNLLKPAACPAH
jgi:hypothetical protein